MKLTLLRHGETDGSRRDLYYGAADIPALPESLAALHENAAAYPRAKRYYTSGLLRTEQTLEAIYGPVAHQQLPGLQEMNFGDFEMKSYQELKDTAAYQAWITDVEHNVCPNGESAPQVLERNRAAMAQVLASGEDAVCVVHGGVTAGLMMTWFGGGRYDYSVKPGTGFTVTFRDGRPVSYERVTEFAGGQAVGDIDGSLIACDLIELAVDLRLGDGVQRRRWLVEDDEGRVLIERAGNGDLLRLAAGNIYAGRIKIRI